MNRSPPLAHLVLGALIAINLGGAACVWGASEISAQPVSSTRLWAPLSLRAAPLPKATTKPLASYAQILARPVFRRTRKPWSPQRSAPAKTSAEPVGKQLDVDISIDGLTMFGRIKRVLVTSKSAPDGVWLSQGAVVEGWTISSIDASGATLKSASGSLRLSLYPTLSGARRRALDTLAPPAHE